MRERAQSAPVGFSYEERKGEGAKARFSDICPIEGYIVVQIHLFRYLQAYLIFFLQDLRSAASHPDGKPASDEKAASNDVSLKSSFGAIATAAKDVIQEGLVGPQKIDAIVFHSRTMERGE